DGWLNLPAVGAVSLVLVASDAWGAGRRRLATLGFVAAGAASAFTVLFKYTGAFIALPMLVAFVLAAHTHGRSVWWGLGGVVAGGLGTLGLTGLGLWARGAGEIFRRTHTELIATYVSDAQPAFFERMQLLLRPLGRPARGLYWMVLAGWASLIPAALTLRRLATRDRIAVALVLVWWVGAQLGVMAQGRFFAYHYHPTGVPSALLFGIACTWALDRIPERDVQRAMDFPWSPLVLAAVLCAMAVHARPASYQGLVNLAWGVESLEEYYGRKRFGTADWPIESQAELSAWLRAHTDPDDRVLVWGFDPVIHVWSERRPASRLIYNFPLALRRSDHDFWLDVLMRDLERTAPPVIVVATDDEVPKVTGFEGDSRDLMVTYPELLTYVLTNYDEPFEIGPYEVRRRRER
ncbi:MAG: hypothetical protein AAF602_33455, partial [Myxococcota bacterium]